MTDQEITSLARELADSLYNDDKTYNSILWWGEEPKERKGEELEHTLRFLLHRYCLVEKEKLKRVMALHIEKSNKVTKGGKVWFFYKGSANTLRYLFPDLRKEVEP